MENLASEASSSAQKKTRLNVTVLPQTSDWLKERGNASQMIDELVAAAVDADFNSALAEQQLEKLQSENSQLKDQLSQLQKELEHQDYQVIRDKVLASLKLGKQAPGYKSAVKVLDRFIAEIGHNR